MTTVGRQLYQCYHAKTTDTIIFCEEGHKFGHGDDGAIPLSIIHNKTPLIIKICQGCEAYEKMGSSVKKEDRGWEK